MAKIRVISKRDTTLNGEDTSNPEFTGADNYEGSSEVVGVINY